MNSVAMIVVLAAATVGLLVYGIVLATGRRRAIVANRLEAYTGVEEQAAHAAQEELGKVSPVRRMLHVVVGRTAMQRVEDNLARADLPMRASEYVLLRLVLAGIGFLCGTYGLGSTYRGVFLAAVGFLTPALFVRIHQHRRRAKFVVQLADALMLLTTSLRSGYGFLKGIELVAKEMADPIAKELNRMLREINLGVTIDQAMTNLGRRMNSEDLDIVISAYLVQKDVGGNLAEIMEKVAETIRERLRIQGDIRVLTTQGRVSGLIVGLLPLSLCIILWLLTPDYFRPMFGPPMVHIVGSLNIPFGALLLLGAFSWQLLGGYLIYRIINIKV